MGPAHAARPPGHEVAFVDEPSPREPQQSHLEEEHLMAIEQATFDPAILDKLHELLLLRELEEFLYAEADLLDNRHYEEWLDLLAEDIRYWVPLRRNFKFGEEWRENSRELEDLAYFDDNKTTLVLRVRQIMTGIHWAEEPLSRISHFMSNIRILEATPSLAEPREVKLGMRFLVYRNRLQDETDILAGKREDVLRRVDGSWQIARRNIFLDQNVLLAKNLTFFF
jgi:3-phenylpropionate/cinnamic acid dioxygenase small subunit